MSFKIFLVYICKGLLLIMKPLAYIPRDKNIIQTIFEENYANFKNIYEKVYAKDYGIYRLELISETVNKFKDCGDWLHGIARIKCTNPDCKHEYFRPFSCKLGLNKSAGIYARHVIRRDCFYYQSIYHRKYCYAYLIDNLYLQFPNY
jgi:hypothetical protein